MTIKKSAVLSPTLNLTPLGTGSAMTIIQWNSGKILERLSDTSRLPFVYGKLLLFGLGNRFGAR